MVAAIRCSASCTLRAAVEALEILGERAAAPSRCPRSSSSAGTAVTLIVVAAEALDLEAEALELGRAADAAPACADGATSSTHRHEQPLRLEPAGRQPLHHPLEQHALVRDVLIDDRDALVVDRDDERVAELAERDHRPDVERRRSRRLQPTVADGDVRLAVASAVADVAAGSTPLPRRCGIQRFGYAPPPSTPGSAVATGVDGARLRPQLQLRRAALPERVHQRAAHDLVHQRLIAEAHLRLRRMHVDVDARPAASR